MRGVIDLYHALQRDDRDLAVHAYRSWGFGNLSREMIEVLNRWASFVYGPLLDDRERLIQEKRSGAYGAGVAESVHRDIRRLGGVRPPREFVFMDRAAIGLGSVFMHLKAEINWYRLFHELIDDFDEATLAARQRSALAAAGVPLPISIEQEAASMNGTSTPVRCALISVADKTGIVPFAAALVARGVALISTGGSAQTFTAAGLPVTEVATVTGFPEMLDGRVKTLHPAIHAGLLARRDRPDDLAALADRGIAPIDLVLCNLYPFTQTVASGAERR